MKDTNPGLFGEQEIADLMQFERRAFLHGYEYVAGVDEAGRGALAGPVVAAAVVLPQGIVIPGIDDSKKLTPAKRDKLFGVIGDAAIAVGVGIEGPSTIDSMNILQASLLAMKNAVLSLQVQPDFLLIDGTFSIAVELPQNAIKKGDANSMSIAAASIVAKVTRDRLMVNYDEQFPGYGFSIHKGYGSAMHLAAIAELGPCAIHRKTFRGVKEYVQNDTGTATIW